MEYGCIYKIVNTINNKIYVGQTTCSLSKRYREHLHSAESRNKMVDAHKGKESCFKGKHHTEKAKKTLSIKHSKQVLCLETNQIYPSSILASKKLKIPDHIGNCCNGKRNTCGGFHWEWA